MSELLKNITVRVVGVSFQNDDGTDRQEILSGLSAGEAMFLKYFEYENEPAYAVTDVLGNQIGNLPKDLSADIYRRFRDCFFAVQIDKITGGDDGLKYGCVVDIDIYDTAPDFIERDVSPAAPPNESANPAAPVAHTAPKNRSVSGLILIVLGVVLALLGLLLLLAVPIGGVIAIVFGVLCVIAGSKYRKASKDHPSADA